MMTSYFVLSFSLKDVYKFDMYYGKNSNFLLTSLTPLIIYFALLYFDKLSFVSILGIGGVISGGLTGALVLLMNKQAKKKGNRKPEYTMNINWVWIVLLSLVFLVGVVTMLV